MIERTVTKRLLSLSKDFKIVLATGARQVGKTTLLKAISDNERSYITLDNRAALDLARNDPEAFFIMYPLPCMIDEVQRAPELFLKIKEIVDGSSAKNLIWLTGSQKPGLMKQVSDTLAGRVVEVDMFPLSQAEKQCIPYRASYYPEISTGVPAIWDYMETLENVILGGYPALSEIRKENRMDWFNSYISTYLLGDIRSEGGECDSQDFILLLRVLAARTAEPINYSTIASEVGMSTYKVQKLVSLLVSYGIIYLLPSYSGNKIKTVTKTPRMHFTDSGLCCALLGIEDINGFLGHPLAGRVFESYVVSELIRNARNNGDYAAFYFYREGSKNKDYGPAEIDLIKEKSGVLYPIEIKMNATPVLKMARWFDIIPEEKRGLGTIVCMCKEKTLLSRSVIALPVSLL